MQWSPNVVLVHKLPQQCAECGTNCRKCSSVYITEMEQELEQLRNKLSDSSSRMLIMEEEFTTAHKLAETENIRLLEEYEKLQERYDRLLENHNRLQKLNHTLETKLLSAVDQYERDKIRLRQNISSINSQLLDARVTICDLEDDLERCRSDCNVAVQLLHCRPSQFIDHKLDSLPKDVQQRMCGAVAALNLEGNQSKIGHCSATSNTVMYSVTQTNTSIVPLTAVARVLTKPTSKPRPGRLVICSQCHSRVTVADQPVQTEYDFEYCSPTNKAKCTQNYRHIDKVSVESRI